MMRRGRGQYANTEKQGIPAREQVTGVLSQRDLEELTIAAAKLTQPILEKTLTLEPDFSAEMEMAMLQFEESAEKAPVKTEMTRPVEPVDIPANSGPADFARAASSTALGTRSYQQDCVRVRVERAQGSNEMVRVLGALCDGMGGLEGGEYASRMAAEGILESFSSIEEEDSEAYSEAIRRISREVYSLSDQDGRRMQCGTTLTCMLLRGNQLRWFSVGDSRIYLFHRNRIWQLNRDHNYASVVSEQLRSGNMHPGQIDTGEKPEALASYVGMEEVSIIDHSRAPILLEPGDVVIQCSDGLYRSLTDEEIAQILMQIPDVNGAAQALTATAVAIPGPHDNTSVLLTQYLGIKRQ
ncbi:MAG: protein phosphatase 2C domain-containing protein [Lachnospiraceae bacterium]|nr:protein phosphatase 2C domain-containing protein [Lachnospiraceae bacterium]